MTAFNILLDRNKRIHEFFDEPTALHGTKIFYCIYEPNVEQFRSKMKISAIKKNPSPPVVQEVVRRAVEHGTEAAMVRSMKSGAGVVEGGRGSGWR